MPEVKEGEEESAKEMQSEKTVDEWIEGREEELMQTSLLSSVPRLE